MALTQHRADRDPGRGTTPSPPPGSARVRDPWFDNAKMLLVTLVVVGHAWVLLPDNLAGNWLYDFLYLWHIPAFVMVTGYLSRSFRYTRRHLSRLLSTVALPYLLFEGAMAAFRTQVGGERLPMLWLDPHWPMWYLAVLFLWRLATPLLRALRPPGAVVLAVVASLAGGLTTGDLLDTARALGLLPFFVLGLVAGPAQVDRLRRPRVRATAAAVLAAGFAAAVLIDGRMATEWLYWRSSYAELGVTTAEGVAVRAGLLAAAVLLALSALALVPRRDGWFSRLGPASLVVYLFHGFAVRAADYAGYEGWAAAHEVAAVPVTTAAAVGVALLLAAPPVARRLGVLVDPVGALRRRSADRPARG